jgi:hypothetical protein
MNHIPDIAFQLLAIAMALAAFLPALVYSYSKGLLEEFQKEHNQQGEDRLLYDNIFSFIYAVDFILTQSIFLVIFSGASGVIIYWVSTGALHAVIAGILLINSYLVYAGIIIWSIIKIERLIKNKTIKIKEKWPEVGCYRFVWLCIVTFHILSSISLSILFIYYQRCANKVVWLNWIIGLTVWWLIFAATIWIIPIIQYSPLMHITNSKWRLRK